MLFDFSHLVIVGGFIHRLDPILGQFAGFYLWWYGLCYSAGFLGMFLFLRRVRQPLGLTLSQVYSLTIFFALGLLLGARLVEVLFYEWPYYREHPWHIPALWLGGMSTHGVLLGSTVGTWLFCRRHGKPFLRIADALVIPGAFFMGIGRIGNFIDGQIVGRLTDVWWGVQFPDAEGFRHPVVLYDGLKNFLLIPWLLYVRQRRPAPGTVLAHFVFWYGFLRIFADLFRHYETSLLGLATGQSFNLFMSLLGAALLIWFRRKAGGPAGGEVAEAAAGSESEPPARLWAQRIVFAAILLFSLTLPSDRTQDIPARYAKRHPGLRYSLLYPRLEPSALLNTPAAEETKPPQEQSDSPPER